MSDINETIAAAASNINTTPELLPLFIGRVSDVGLAKTGDKEVASDTFFLTVTNYRKTFNCITSPSMLNDKFGDDLVQAFKGQIVEILLEKNVEGVTTYYDKKTKSVKSHKQSGYSINKVSIIDDPMVDQVIRENRLKAMDADKEIIAGSREASLKGMSMRISRRMSTAEATEAAVIPKPIQAEEIPAEE